MLHERTKHIDIKSHYIEGGIDERDIKVSYYDDKVSFCN